MIWGLQTVVFGAGWPSAGWSPKSSRLAQPAESSPAGWIWLDFMLNYHNNDHCINGERIPSSNEEQRNKCVTLSPLRPSFSPVIEPLGHDGIGMQALPGSWSRPGDAPFLFIYHYFSLH